MHRVNVRELKLYSLAELADAFGVETARARAIIKELMVRGIVRYREDFSPKEIDPDEEDAGPDELYKFTFVGMVMVGDIVIVAYPKYFRDRLPSEDELKQTFRVLKHSILRTSIARLADIGGQAVDRLPVMLALLDLYSEYGEYSNYVETRELNGRGSIDWVRTINNHLPIIDDGRPIYTEFETRKTLRNESDFIARLHRAVLTECSQELEEAGVADLLSLDSLWLSDEDVDDFGDVDSLEWRLARERGSQFIDWKIAVIDLLELYLLNRQKSAESDEIQTLGSMSYYHLWETACKVAFGDLLGRRLDSLDIRLAGKWMKRGGETLLEIIPRPLWERYIDGDYRGCGDVSTFIPDTISFAVDADGQSVFCIYDAKYYAPSLNGKMKGQPGLESVTKQFLYQKAYEPFIQEHDFSRVVNAFLVPSADAHLNKMARVSFSDVMGKVDFPLSNYVDMWALPAYEVFDAYLENQRIDKGRLRGVWDGGLYSGLISA